MWDNLLPMVGLIFISIVKRLISDLKDEAEYPFHILFSTLNYNCRYSSICIHSQYLHWRNFKETLCLCLSYCWQPSNLYFLLYPSFEHTCVLIFPIFCLSPDKPLMVTNVDTIALVTNVDTIAEIQFTLFLQCKVRTPAHSQEEPLYHQLQYKKLFEYLPCVFFFFLSTSNTLFNRGGYFKNLYTL